MAKDLARIKRNVRKMAEQNAPEEDIDGYIASEGVSLDDVRNFNEASADRGFFTRVDDVVRGAADAVTFGYADEFAAKMDELTGLGDSYDENVKKERERDENGGWERTAGQIGGAALGTGGLMALPGGAVAMGARSIPGLSGIPGFAGRVGFGAASGAGLGATDAALRGEDVQTGATLGGVLGAAGPVVGAVASPIIQKGLSKLGLAPSRPGGKELYTAAKELKDIRARSEVPDVVKGRVYPKDMKYGERLDQYINRDGGLPVHQDSTLVELNNIAKRSGPGRDFIKKFYGDEVSRAAKQVDGLADHWFPTKVDEATGAVKTIDPKLQHFRDKLLDFGDKHDDAFNHFSKQANYRKLQELLGQDNAIDFMDSLWSPAVVAEANKGMQRSLGVGLNKEATSKITKKAPVEIGGPQSLTNRGYNSLRHAIENYKSGQRSGIDDHLAKLLLTGKTSTGGKERTAVELLSALKQTVKSGQLPADEARKLIISLLQGIGSNEEVAEPIVQSGLLTGGLITGLGHRVGGAAVDMANPFN